MNLNKTVFGFMKTEKTNLYKIFYFDTYSCKYVGFSGLYSSIEEFLDFVKKRIGFTRFYSLGIPYLNFIRIPFFGYFSPQFTALGPRALAVNEKAEV